MKYIYIFLFAVFSLYGCSDDEVKVDGVISGVVKDELTGKLLSEVKVSITPEDKSVVTTEEGTFVFEKLKPDTYNLTYMKSGYESQTKSIKVEANRTSPGDMLLTPIVPELKLTPVELVFGKDVATLAMDIANTGKGSLQWSISEEMDWLACEPESGTTTNEVSSVVVNVYRTGLERGNYTGTIVVSSNGGSLNIPVSMEVGGVGLEVIPEEVNFGSLTNSLRLTLKNNGTGTLEYSVKSSNEWLVTDRTSGAVTQTAYVTAVVSREGLSAGKYSATLTFTVNGTDLVIPVQMEVAVNEKPTVTVEKSTEVTYNGAVLHGTMVSVGSAKVTRYGFCWGETSAPTVENDASSNLKDCVNPMEFQSKITDLKPETKYYFRAYAENSVGFTYSSSELTFMTTGLPVLPGVESGKVEEITSTAAKAQGNITFLGNVLSLAHYGHVWGTAAQPTLENGKYTDLGTADAPKAYVSEMTGLEANTTYYVRAYATNEKGTAYGDDVAFTTLKTDAVIKTSEVTEIVHNAATCGGVVESTGGHTIVEKGVCWCTEGTPLITGNHAAASDDKFSCRITGLTKETLYKVRAYVKTSEDHVFYGDEKAFTTTKEVSLPTLKKVSVSNIQTTSATFVSKIESNGNSVVSECGFVWSEKAKPTLENGNKSACDPSSSEMGKNITGLADGTTYHVRAYAKNALGVAYSEEDVEFTTLAITVPEFASVTAENIGRTTAYVSAVISSTGNAEISECGFCWATSPNPTVYDNKISCEVATSFKVKLQDLPLLTTVYVRAYAINERGTAYSKDDVSFTTTNTDVDIWDGVSVAAKFAGGMGTASDPIIINSADQLKLLADNVNNGKSTYNGIHFSLNVNIGLANHAWTAIGSNSNQFRGVFGGNGKTIDGLKINTTATGQGLFGYNGGMIKSLTVKGSVAAGGTAGGICGSNAGILDSCQNYATITVSGGDNVGGICGSNNGRIQNSTNHGAVVGKNNVGGIAGSIIEVVNAVISGCENKGSVSGSGNAGGICGFYMLKAASATPLYDCQNLGVVTATNYAGGIIGYCYLPAEEFCRSGYDSGSSIKNCNNAGSVKGIIAGGGIIGYLIVDAVSDRCRSNTFYISYMNLYNCCNNGQNATYGLIGVKGGKGVGRVDITNSYWLYDIVNDIGNEAGIAGDVSSWYNHNASGCYLKGDTGKDIVTLLNNWVSNNSGSVTYKRWKYKTIDGFACPVFEEE